MVEKRQNKWLFQKQYFCCSPATSKSVKFPTKWFWRHIKIFANYFKGLAVFLFIREHFISFKECGENLNTMPELLL